MGGRSNVWVMTGRIAETASIQDIKIDKSPFRIGRANDLSLTLPYAAVSNVHAELIVEPHSLSLRDLNSTNGTFVNGVRLTGEMPLQSGDLLQFADVSLRLRRQEDEVSQPIVDIAPPAAPRAPDLTETSDTSNVYAQFDSFLMLRSVVPHYQPIVSLRDNKLVGSEVLARSRIEGLRTPAEMFTVASQRNLEEDLSRMLRLACLEHNQTGQAPSLFLNTHPSEILSMGLLHSLQKLRDLSSDAQMTFEIREPDSADTVRLKQLREAMSDLGIRLAYDNFGSGQSRRLELAAVQPEFVKFDMHLIRDIHLAPAAQRTMLANLIRMVHELGISSVAVGVETEAEHIVCCDVGFEYGQGFYYGRPASRAEATTDTSGVLAR